MIEFAPALIGTGLALVAYGILGMANDWAFGRII
jgi:hypothetical protein